MALSASISNLGGLSGLGSVIGGIGGLASGIGSLFGSRGGVSTYKSAKLMQVQNAWQRRYDQWYLNHITKATALNEYPWKRRSLESAGFNPALAYMSPNVSMPSAGQVPSQIAQEDSRSASFAQAMQGFLEMQQVGASIRNTNANSDLQTAQTVTEMYKQFNIQADTDLKQIDKKLQEGNLRWQEREKLINYRRNLVETKARLMDAYSSRIVANAKDVEADTTRIERDKYNYEKTWRNRHPKQAGFLGGVSNYTNTIGRLIRPR